MTPQYAETRSLIFNQKMLSQDSCKDTIHRISCFKRRGVYLILVLLGAAFIRERRLFQISKQKMMKWCVNSKQSDIS